MTTSQSNFQKTNLRANIPNLTNPLLARWRKKSGRRVSEELLCLSWTRLANELRTNGVPQCPMTCRAYTEHIQSPSKRLFLGWMYAGSRYLRKSFVEDLCVLSTLQSVTIISGLYCTQWCCNLLWCCHGHFCCTELAKKVCPRLRHPASDCGGEFTQPSTNCFGHLCMIGSNPPRLLSRLREPDQSGPFSALLFSSRKKQISG